VELIKDVIFKQKDGYCMTGWLLLSSVTIDSFLGF